MITDAWADTLTAGDTIGLISDRDTFATTLTVSRITKTRIFTTYNNQPEQTWSKKTLHAPGKHSAWDQPAKIVPLDDVQFIQIRQSMRVRLYRKKITDAVNNTTNLKTLKKALDILTATRDPS